MRENKRHNLLAQSSMGSKTMTIESCEVMLGPARANYRVGVTDRNKISLAIKRHLITASGTFPINNERNSRDGGSDVHDIRQFQSCTQVYPHERSQGTVMLHERIGDRADDAHRIRPETPVEFLLEENHARRPVLIRLVVHTRIGN